MPIYEYFCPNCKNEFELRLSFSEADCTPLCPKCYSEAQRLISSFACKTGGNIQASEKPFRSKLASETFILSEEGAYSRTSSVLITPPPKRLELLSSPQKSSIKSKRKKR